MKFKYDVTIKLPRSSSSLEYPENLLGEMLIGLLQRQIRGPDCKGPSGRLIRLSGGDALFYCASLQAQI